MVAAFVRSHGTEFVKAAGTTDTYALTSLVPAGNLLVMALVHDNAAVASKPLVSSITKMSGETASWVHLGRALSTSTSTGAFADGELWAIKTTVAWTSGTSLTVTYDTTITMKSQNILEYSGVEAVLRSTAGTAYSTTTTAASAVTTGTTPVIGDLAIGLLWGSNIDVAQAGDTDTTGGSWATKVGVGSTGGSAATNNYGITQHKILTAASHQTLNNSAAMTAGNGAIVAILQATIDPLVTQAAYRWYDEGTESGAVALAAQDTAVVGDISNGDATGTLRVRLQETAGGVQAATTDWQLQWENNLSGTWAPVDRVGVLADTYPSTNADANVNLTTAGTFSGQSFLGTGGALTRAGFYMAKVGTMPGSVTAALFAHTGTFGSGGTGVGSPLATSATTISAASLTGTAAWVYFDFAGSVALAAGTPYVIAVGTDTVTDISNCAFFRSDSSTPTHGGNRSNNSSGSWAASTSDAIFEVYAASTVVPYDSPNLTNGGATTTRLTGGTGTFGAGKVSEDALMDDVGIPANGHTELLYALKVIAADLAHGDVLRFRVLRDGVTTGLTYTQTPRIDLVKSAVTGGTGTGSWSFTGTAAGKRTPKATGTGTWTFAGVAVGKRTPVAITTGSWTFAGTAVGSAPAVGPKTGTAAGAWAFAGAAVGKRTPQATAVGTWTLSGAAVGKRTPKATGTGSWDFAGTAVGKRTPKATGTGSWTWVGAAVGKRTPQATASGTWTFAGAAVGKRTPKATATGTWTYAGTAVGAAPAVGVRTGTASGTWTFAGAAVGKRTPKATGTGTWAWVGVTAAKTEHRGTAAGTWIFAGTTVGKRPARATAVGSWTLAGAAVGKRTPKATAVGTWAWAGVAAAKTEHRGAAVGTWTFAGTAAGKRTPKATGTGSWTFAGTAAAKTLHRGTATGTWTYSGAAIGSAPVVGQNDGFAFGTTTWTGTAAAKTQHRGAAAGTWTFAGVTAAKTLHRGAASGTWTYAGTAAGKRPARAVATGTWTWVGAASGKRTPKAITTGTWTWVGLTAAKTIRRGAATGTWTYVGTASAAGLRRGTATGAWLYVGTAAGRAPVKGTSLGTWTYVGTATGIAPALDFADGKAAGTWWFTGYAPGLGRLFATPASRTSVAGPDPRTSVAARDPRVSVAAASERVSVSIQ